MTKDKKPVVTRGKWEATLKNIRVLKRRIEKLEFNLAALAKSFEYRLKFNKEK